MYSSHRLVQNFECNGIAVNLWGCSCIQYKAFVFLFLESNLTKLLSLACVVLVYGLFCASLVHQGCFLQHLQPYKVTMFNCKKQSTSCTKMKKYPQHRRGNTIVNSRAGFSQGLPYGFHPLPRLVLCGGVIWSLYLHLIYC